MGFHGCINFTTTCVYALLKFVMIFFNKTWTKWCPIVSAKNNMFVDIGVLYIKMMRIRYMVVSPSSIEVTNCQSYWYTQDPLIIFSMLP